MGMVLGLQSTTKVQLPPTIKFYYTQSVLPKQGLNKYVSLNPIVSWRRLSHWEIWHSCESETLCDCHWPDSCHAVHVQSHSQTIDCCTVCCIVVWTLHAVSFPNHQLLHCILHGGLGMRLLHCKQSHAQTTNCCTVTQWSVVWESDYFTSNSTHTHTCVP